MNDAVLLLKNLLAIPSVNGKDQEGKVAEFLCSYFETAGIAATVQKIDETHGNVIAVLEGENPSKTVIWNGHLDTVPYGDLRKWITNPVTPVEEDGYLYGRGASDMKSGLAAMVYALCACQKAGKKPIHTIQFLGTCDEEKGGLGALKILEAGLMADSQELLIGEPTGCCLGVAQKGCLWLEITVAGKTSHGAYPDEGCNAISHGYEIAGELQSYIEEYYHPILGLATAQITQITGGVAPNMTPDHCSILMDIRTVPGLTREMVCKEADRIAGIHKTACHPDLKVEFQVKNDRCAIEINAQHPSVQKLETCLKEAGQVCSHIGINYFTDASILAKDSLDMGVILFGPGEPDMAHKPNERVEIKKYMLAIEILEKMLQQK